MEKNGVGRASITKQVGDMLQDGVDLWYFAEKGGSRPGGNQVLKEQGTDWGGHGSWRLRRSEWRVKDFTLKISRSCFPQG